MEKTTQNYEKTVKDVKNAVLGNSNYSKLQNEFDEIGILKEHGIIGLSRRFFLCWLGDGEDSDKTTRNRISRLIRNCRYLQKDHWINYQNEGKFRTKTYRNRVFWIVEGNQEGSNNSEEEVKNERGDIFGISCLIGEEGGIPLEKSVLGSRKERKSRDNLIECYQETYNLDTKKGFQFTHREGRVHGHFHGINQEDNKIDQERIEDSENDDGEPVVIQRSNGIPK